MGERLLSKSTGSRNAVSFCSLDNEERLYRSNAADTFTTLNGDFNRVDRKGVRTLFLAKLRTVRGQVAFPHGEGRLFSGGGTSIFRSPHLFPVVERRVIGNVSRTRKHRPGCPAVTPGIHLRWLPGAKLEFPDRERTLGFALEVAGTV
jgi:hypothetical protein